MYEQNTEMLNNQYKISSHLKRHIKTQHENVKCRAATIYVSYLDRFINHGEPCLIQMLVEMIKQICVT